MFAKKQIILPFRDPNSQNMTTLEKCLQKCRLFLNFLPRIPRILRIWKNHGKIEDYSGISCREFPEYAGLGKMKAKVMIILEFPAEYTQNMPGLEKN